MSRKSNKIIMYFKKIQENSTPIVQIYKHKSIKKGDAALLQPLFKV